VGFDAVGSKVLAGLLEEFPKRVVIARHGELEELGTRGLVGAFGVVR
jgi:hypothetical protein